MMVNALVGGTPGKDCGGFCKFCYFKGMNYKNTDSIPLGCRFCPPHQVGCDHCYGVINDIKNGFRPLSEVLSRLENILRWHKFLGTLDYKNLKIITASMADIMFYPQLFELISTLNDGGLQVHLGYTSGKGIKDRNIAEELISSGVDEINFSVISMNPEIRRKWMADKTPEESYKALRIFCDSIDVNVSTVVIPGVINKADIFKTCSILEDWGIKSFILSRFVNFKREGLIYNERQVIDGIDTQPFARFQDLVKMVDDEFSFRVIGSPNTLYKLSKKENKHHLKKLPPVTSEATIITSKLSFEPLEQIFKLIAQDEINVIGVDKEIGDLITQEDLVALNLDDVKSRVVIPAGALVHQKVAQKIFSKDGTERTVLRGPLCLFYYDFEVSENIDMLEYEIRSFNALIDRINNN